MIEGRIGVSEVDLENDRGVMETLRLSIGLFSLRGWQDLVVKVIIGIFCFDELIRVILGLREWYDLKINYYCIVILLVLLFY